ISSGCCCSSALSECTPCVLTVTIAPPIAGADCKSSCNLAHGRCDVNGDCRCDPGWEGDSCERCVRMPGCLHGTCHQPWQCICLSGWAGRFCDKDVHICEHQRPCQNSARCINDREGDYSCVCPDGFHGKNCEVKRGPCELAGSPCQNGGTCLDNNGYADAFACRCLAGFVGDLCELDVDDCLMRPCANGATCHDGINRFSCKCPAGFEGRFCTSNLDDCASQPCRNGGKCYDRVNDFDCVCPEGYAGKSCATVLEPQREEQVQTAPRNAQRVNYFTPESATQVPPQGTRPQPIAGGLLKISVKEVVAQEESGLAETRFVILAVFGACTLLLALVTATLVL
uniref:Protein delta homolog 2 n=1 Tax=Latimeria chalumnae TaxID=7897 RepID=H3A302_LATCH